jgi:AcrR family transcriptional regulator
VLTIEAATGCQWKSANLRLYKGLIREATRISFLTVSTKRLQVVPAKGGRPARGGVRLGEAILEAARKLCFAEGVDGVSARKIANEVGCSATAIYSHYHNLDDVLHHLRMEGHALLADYFRRVDSSLEPVGRLREFGRAYYRFAIEHPKYYEMMFLSRFKDAPRREFVEREIFTLLLLRDVVHDGVRAGVFRDDRDELVLSNAIWSQIHGLASLATTGRLVFLNLPGGPDDPLETVLDCICAGVLRQR